MVNMNRRQFCQSAVAVALTGALPARIALAQRSKPSKVIPAEIPALTLEGRTTSIEAAAIKELGESLQGSLLLDGDFGYDGARSVWNGMHDRLPALIVRAGHVEDVSNAVTFARERELLLSVKGGGHSWPGRSVADNAMMIDLGSLRDVVVDVDGRRARVGGGALLWDLDVATQRHGLATTTGVVSHTGVGGYTLGGGYGRLSRKCGLTIDNLLAAQMVTADGQVRRVSPEENADLFWAIRGGGGNFGVVTAFEFALHEVGPEVLGGSILWPIEQAREVLEFYVEYSTGLPDDMDVSPSMGKAPDGTDVVGMGVCCFGDPARAEKQLAPLRQLGRPLLDRIGPVPYLTLQTEVDGLFRPGVRSYVKSGMVREFTPALVDAMVESFDPQRMVGIGFHTAGGAVARVDETATAWPHRNAAIMIGAFTVWTDPADDDARIKANKEQWAALQPHTGGYYENIQAEVSGSRANFGPAYDRLVAIKDAFDPMNLFRLNNNVRPSV